MWRVLVELAITPFGLLVISSLAAAIVLFWDWRITLISLFCVQVGLAVNAMLEQGLPFHWALVQSAVMGLACLILALSASRVGGTPSQFQAGTWMLRVLIMVLVAVAWQVTDIRVQLPEMNMNVSRLYVWLGVCALITMSLSNNPFFIGAALLLWLMPVQAATSAILAIPALTVLLGMLELLVALACSYLILVDQEPENLANQILTDIRFPEFTNSPKDTRVRRVLPMPHRQIAGRKWPADNRSRESNRPPQVETRPAWERKATANADQTRTSRHVRQENP